MLCFTGVRRGGGGGDTYGGTVGWGQGGRGKWVAARRCAGGGGIRLGVGIDPTRLAFNQPSGGGGQAGGIIIIISGHHHQWSSVVKRGRKGRERAPPARSHLAQERARTQAWRESYDDASISRTLIRLMRGRGREHEHEQKGGRHEGGHATRKSERAGGGPREGSRKRWQKRISPPKRGSWAVVCSGGGGIRRARRAGGREKLGGEDS